MSLSGAVQVRSDFLVQSLSLFPVDAATGYELPDVDRVAQIASSILRSGELMNPIVVDVSRNLVIDGHHRLEAFRWLGLEGIPAYNAEYLGDLVAVRGWNRPTTAPAEDVAAIFAALNVSEIGPWRVLAQDAAGTILAGRAVPSALAAGVLQDRISRLLAAIGHPISFEAETRPMPADGRTRVYIEPIVGKEQVLEIVDDGLRFPHQINRHLVAGRPIAMRIPISAVVSLEAFSDFLDRLVASTSTMRLRPGARSDGRFYEEQTTMFVRR